MPRRWVSVLLPWLVFIPLGLAGRAMQAAPDAPFTVNSTADMPDANIGNGLCATAGGLCTLRAAVQEASANPNPDTINLPAGNYQLSGPGAPEDAGLNGDLDITGTVTIAGAGAASTIINGNGSNTNDRVFDIQAGTVNISGVKIINGKAVIFGGGIYVSSGATLNLSNSVVQANSAFSGGIAAGGGIYSEGRLTISGSTVSTNTLTGLPQFGAGISHIAGSLVMTDSTVSGNTTLGDGGGIYVGDSVITVTRSSIINNQAQNGAGMYVFGLASIVNSTISGNLSTHSGAGLYSEAASTNLFNVTVTDNFADSDANGSGIGGGVAQISGAFSFRNSIIAGNNETAPFGGGGTTVVDGDCAGIVTSQGLNLMQGYDAGHCTVNGGGVTLAVPLLGPLANNGGSTRTHALLAGSPAIDAGALPDCTDALGAPLTRDQRGAARPLFGKQSLRCDLGAYEFVGPVFVPLFRR